MKINKPETSTGVVVSEDVIEKVVSIAALEVPGVSAVPSNKDLKGIWANKSTKPVKAKIGDGVVEIDVNIKLKAGRKIDQVCEEIQNNIKVSVQNITNYALSKINIHVIDIDIEENNE